MYFVLNTLMLSLCGALFSINMRNTDRRFVIGCFEWQHHYRHSKQPLEDHLSVLPILMLKRALREKFKKWFILYKCTIFLHCCECESIYFLIFVIGVEQFIITIIKLIVFLSRHNFSMLTKNAMKTICFVLACLEPHWNRWKWGDFEGIFLLVTAERMHRHQNTSQKKSRMTSTKHISNFNYFNRINRFSRSFINFNWEKKIKKNRSRGNHGRIYDWLWCSARLLISLSRIAFQSEGKRPWINSIDRIIELWRHIVWYKKNPFIHFHHIFPLSSKLERKRRKKNSASIWDGNWFAIDCTFGTDTCVIFLIQNSIDSKIKCTEYFHSI